MNSQYNHFGEVENAPNAAKLLTSLRHLDYDNISAINDLADNSIDANASHIWIDIIAESKNSIERIEITDDGIGMNWETLNEALKLGSDTSRNASYDLGLYGMGLITASISFGKRLEVISKTVDSEVIAAVQDIDEIVEQNRFFKTMRALDPQEIAGIAQLMMEKLKNTTKTRESIITQPKSFTRVIISKLDRLQFVRASGLEEHLIRRLGQVFRKFIKAGKVSLYVNGILVTAIDPIYDFEPNILTDEIVKVEDNDIRIVVAELRDNGIEINKSKGINIPNQGFYILRNNREIAAGETLGILSKHNDLNTLRIEFSYPGTLDSILGTTFSKQRIKLNQSVEDKVDKICEPFIKQVRLRAKKRQEANRTTTEDFTDIEKYITQKSHLLKNPMAEIEVREPSGSTAVQPSKPTVDPEGIRLNINKRQRINMDSLKVRFDTTHSGEKAPLWESDQERDRVIVRWNVDHPFYQRVVAPNADNPDVLNPMAFLIYCFASAELISKIDTDSSVILDNIRWDVGRNLAVLLQ
jgi:hypothetical protein